MYKYEKVIAIILLMTSVMMSSAQTRSKSDIVFHSGYGYSWLLDSNAPKDGFATNQAIYYFPFKHFGFGLNFGLSKNRKNLFEKGCFEKNTYTYFGPSAAYFPVRTKHHEVFVTAGLNYVRSETSWLLAVETSSDGHISEAWQDYRKNHFASDFSLGYSYKIYKGLGIGFKINALFCQKTQVAGLLNLTLSL